MATDESDGAETDAGEPTTDATLSFEVDEEGNVVGHGRGAGGQQFEIESADGTPRVTALKPLADDEGVPFEEPSRTEITPGDGLQIRHATRVVAPERTFDDPADRERFDGPEDIDAMGFYDRDSRTVVAFGAPSDAAHVVGRLDDQLSGGVGDADVHVVTAESVDDADLSPAGDLVDEDDVVRIAEDEEVTFGGDGRAFEPRRLDGAEGPERYTW